MTKGQNALQVGMAMMRASAAGEFGFGDEPELLDIRDREVHLADILPSAHDLSSAAYRTTVGDDAVRAMSKHARLAYKRKDATGLSKAMVAAAARRRNERWRFAKMEQSIRKNWWRLPMSSAYHALKEGGGSRLICDPCEQKRLASVLVRDFIGPRIERQLLPRQFGGRTRQAVGSPCPRDGATLLDDTAWTIHKAAVHGFRAVASVDLKDAFGGVPKAWTIRCLMDLGLDREAATYVWGLVRLDARDRSGRVYFGKDRGIEQGNSLSVDIMNLLLAPLLREVERRSGCVAFAYIDDIYLLAVNVEAAELAFQVFERIARTKADFRNVRALAGPKNPDPKASRIVNLEVEPVEVLKTYLADAKEIALTPDKLVKAQMALKKLGIDRPTVEQVRRTPVGKDRKGNGYTAKALSRKWIRTVFGTVEENPERQERPEEQDTEE
jgi:hypothetical protein